MTAQHIHFAWEGFDEFDELLTQMVDDFGYKDSKRILVRTVKKAMLPVLYTAKLYAPEDTGALRASLQVEARYPTSKDRRSKYVDQSDAVIAAVTTAPGWKLKKLKWQKAHRDKSGEITHYTKEVGIDSDMRAPAMEFGTAKTPAHPFLRAALESEASGVVNVLSETLAEEINKYEARKAKKAAKQQG